MHGIIASTDQPTLTSIKRLYSSSLFRPLSRSVASRISCWSSSALQRLHCARPYHQEPHVLHILPLFTFLDFFLDFEVFFRQLTVFLVYFLGFNVWSWRQWLEKNHQSFSRMRRVSPNQSTCSLWSNPGYFFSAPGIPTMQPALCKSWN
jgi:hypothetical protein